jgi:hypothetical protein
MLGFTKSYEGIIKGFTKTIADLRELAESNLAKEIKKTETITLLKAECVALEAVGKKAIATADKLAGLLE